MMSLNQIAELSRDQGISAARKKKIPLVIEKEDDAARMLPHIPNLGSYVPDGWEEVQRFFVDGSGWSDPGELAAHGCISFEDLVTKVVPGRGYAIVEEGQFQLRVAEFKKVSVH